MGILSRVTGVDLGHHSIKAVTLKPSQNNRYSIVAYTELPVPDGIFADNDMLGYQKIVKKLKELKKTLPRFSRKVALSLPESAIISKELQLDSYENPHEKLLAMMSEQCGILPADLAIDYQALPYEPHLAGSGPTYRVFATRKTLVSQRINALQTAGLTPYLINGHGQGLLQLYQHLIKTGERAATILLHIAEQQATLCFYDQHQAPRLHTWSYDALEGLAGIRYPEEWLARITPTLQRLPSLYMPVAPQCVWVAGVGSDNLSAVEQLSRHLGWPCTALTWENLLVNAADYASCNPRFAGAVGMALQGVCWHGGRYA